MFEEWRVLHIDENEEESRAFCRALEQNQFAGQCDTVRSIAEGRAWLEESEYAPHVRARPDIVVLNWHAERDEEVLDLTRWMRAQPQFRDTPLAVWVGAGTPASIRETARNAGVTELVNKPDHFSDLVDQTEELLQRCVSRCLAR
jgi:DNA-binding response OmpR family regulator